MKLFITPGGHKLTNKKFTIKIRTGDTLSKGWLVRSSLPLPRQRFSCLVYGYRSRSRSRNAKIIRARESPRPSIVCMHNLSLNSFPDDKKTNGKTKTHTVWYKHVSNSIRNRLARSVVLLVVLKLEIKRSSHHAYTVECFAETHTLRAQIKLNETNNLARVSNRKNERRVTTSGPG